MRLKYQTSHLLNKSVLGRAMRVILALLATLVLTGCTHRQLSRSMVQQASTVMDIEYQMVLDNIAMFTANPAVLPWHIRINDGTVQVNDEGGMPELGVQWGGTPGFTRGIRAVRSVTEQWGAHAIIDPLAVKTLQDIYRQAIGLAPMPDPPILAQITAIEKQRQSPSAETPKADASGEAAAGAEQLPPGRESDQPAEVEDFSRGTPYEGSPLARLRGNIAVPVGWFCAGRKCDVPEEACYVGHHGDHYVWVMPEHVEDLSHFTLIILSITKHGVATTDAPAPSRGLVYVRH